MDTRDIISSMVKGRECCRKLVQSYESERSRRQLAPGTGTDVGMLRSAESTASQMLQHLSQLPAKPCDTMLSDEARRYTSKLLGDIRDLLEKAIMLEREMRATAPHREALP
jgi:hypothetical protein